MTPSEQLKKFADLTWQELEAWAGPRVVDRGKRYTKRVRALGIASRGGLAARVTGTAMYATWVDRREGGDLVSCCSCPFAWGPCKHAVALVLLALEALKDGLDLPAADPEIEDRLDDLRLPEAAAFYGGDLAGTGPPDGRPSSTDLHDYIRGLDRDDLVDLLIELAESLPTVNERLRDRQRLHAGEAEKIVRDLRKEIRSLASEPSWWNSWTGEGQVPDYSGVQERMEALLASGHADEVVALGEELFRLGRDQVEMSDDDGEVSLGIARCLNVVLRALPKTSMPVADRILWEIDARMEDEYGILEGVISQPPEASPCTEEDWSTVADILVARLETMPAPTPDGDVEDWTRNWRRQTLIREITTALENAGREEESIDLLEREVEATRGYPELVDALLAAGRREEARRWAETGFLSTVEDRPGIAWGLEERLRTLAADEKDLTAVAAFRAFEFFDDPRLESYLDLSDAAEAAGVWDRVRPFILWYLETGKRPEKVKAIGDWPLPSIGLPAPDRRGHRRGQPHLETLVRIALHEGRHDEALELYEKLSRKDASHAAALAPEVASAVRDTHPDVSLGIWREAAESWISRVKPSAYQEAGRYLRKMKDLYRELDRMEEWKAYRDELRNANRRRPRMLEVLNRLEQEGGRILDG